MLNNILTQSGHLMMGHLCCSEVKGVMPAETCRSLGYEMVYLPLRKVAHTPFHIQKDDIVFARRMEQQFMLNNYCRLIAFLTYVKLHETSDQTPIQFKCTKGSKCATSTAINHPSLSDWKAGNSRFS